MISGQEIDIDSWQKNIAKWEWQWVNKLTECPLSPNWNPIDLASSLYFKYRQLN